MNHEETNPESKHSMWRKIRLLDIPEAAREKLRRFINAASEKEVLLTRGTTTGLNWVAVGFGDLIVEEGDEIYITPM